MVSVKQNEIFRIPIHNIEQIITFGYMGASPGLMKLCADNNVSLTFLSPQGRYISRSQGPTKGNVLLRKAQYKNSDEPNYALHLCKLFIGGKIQNYRNILRRFIRDNGDDGAIAVFSTKRKDTVTGRSVLDTNTGLGFFFQEIVIILGSSYEVGTVLTTKQI